MRKRYACRLFLIVFACMALMLSLGLRAIFVKINFDGDFFCKGLFLLCFCLLFYVLFEILITNKFYKGIKYCISYVFVKNRFERQLLDAGYGIQRSYYIDLPKIRLTFDKNLSSGLLKVRNSIKFNRKLDDMNLSSGLGRYIVEAHYMSDDNNWYIYHLVDAKNSYRIDFSNLDAFLSYCSNLGDYLLFLDGRTRLKIQHTLIVGQTGSGKTYTCYSLILQMLYKSIKYHLYFADPKGSSLAVLGESLCPNNTAVNVEDIINLIAEFTKQMQQRKTELKCLLQGKLDSDYSDFGLEPYVLFIDEYASFMSVIAAKDKSTRDHVKSMIHEVVLQGRQLGFFVTIVMQKSNADTIDTLIRDNLPLKIVLGNAENTTYITAFGNGVDIPQRNNSQGEGVFTEPVLAPQPKLVQFPQLSFDILDAASKAPVV